MPNRAKRAPKGRAELPLLVQRHITRCRLVVDFNCFVGHYNRFGNRILLSAFYKVVVLIDKCWICVQTYRNLLMPKKLPRPGRMTAQLWGALGQGTMDEVQVNCSMVPPQLAYLLIEPYRLT